MKKVPLFLLLLAVSIHAEVWRFTHFKDHTSTMRKDFLLTLKQLFKASVFIETGTGGGATTERAAQVFEEVYSVEIQPNAFATAQQRLRDYANVTLYNQDSVKALRTIVQHLNPDEKTIFFLDAHYNGMANGRGEKNTPALEELDVIFSSRLSDPVIVIDDARTFRPQEEQENDYKLSHCDQVFGYPHVKEVVERIKKHRFDYKVYVYGDLIIGYAEDIEVSPLIQFMTADMVYNNTIAYDIEAAQSRLPHDVSVREVEALASIVESKILYGPATYHVFFEMWLQLLSSMGAR